MEYFLLKPFDRGCRLKIMKKEPDIIFLSKSGSGELPDFTVIPQPFISNRFKELLEQYLPSMEFIPCLLEGEKKADLWAFHPKEFDAEQAQFYPDGAVRAVKSMGLMPIFLIRNYKKASYVINLALAESLLRRSYCNLTLEQIETRR